MRTLTVLLAAVALFCFAESALAQDYAGPIRGPVVVPQGVAVKVTEYVMIDGRRVAVAEWTEIRVPAQAASHCPQCGTACTCNPCKCGATYWDATCAAAPKTIKAASPPPPIILPPAAPVYVPQPYYPPGYAQPMPPRGVVAQGPFTTTATPAPGVVVNNTWSNGTTRTAPTPTYVVPAAPRGATTARPPLIGAGFQFQGPFGGGFGVSGCVGGG